MSQVLELAGGKLTNLTAGTDIEVSEGPFGDNAAPRGGAPSPPIWTPDGAGIVEDLGHAQFLAEDAFDLCHQSLISISTPDDRFRR